jgi:hypothetical protein
MPSRTLNRSEAAVVAISLALAAARPLFGEPGRISTGT